MRYLSLAAVLALAVGAALIPQAAEPGQMHSVSVERPAVAVCSVEEGSGRSTTVSVLSTVDGTAQLTLFAGGDAAGTADLQTGASGSESIDVVDVAAVGVIGGLVELPVADSAAGVVFTGDESFAAEACQSVPDREVMVAGGSTTSGAIFELHLMNPYSGEAAVKLTVVSEAGLESSDRLESFVVPARASTIIDLSEIIPGRETVSVTVETIRGSVVAVGRQAVESDRAVWRAVAGAQDWFVPLGSEAGTKRVLLTSPVNAEIQYQIDGYGPDGFEENQIFGTLAARGQDWIDLTGLFETAAAIRVIATGPVVPTLWLDSGAGLAATPGAATPANRWFLPGASALGDGRASIVLLNTGIETATISMRALRNDTIINVFELPADSVIEVALDFADGYLIESTDPLVALWSAQRGEAISVAIGVPLSDG